MNNLKTFFNPKSIAVIGVSENPSKLSSTIFANIIESGFKKDIFPVNPKYKKLFGVKAYKSVLDIKQKIDLAIIAVPAKLTPQILTEIGKAQIPFTIIISAGFKEIGPKGEILEEKIKQISKRYKIRILGPNCLGSINTINNLNASFASLMPPKGNIAFITQSGAVATAMLDMSLKTNIGFSHFVSLGNKADIEESELIEYFFNDDNVTVIGAYLEEIHNGRKLIQLLDKYKGIKPFILLKPGESKQAQKAIASHTGSMSGPSRIIKAMTKQTDTIQAKNLTELFNYLATFSLSKKLQGNRLAIITNAGGPAIIATDLLVKNNLELAKLEQKTKLHLKKTLPKTASINNPIDVIGDALAERYQAPIEILLKDKNVDGIIIILTPQLVTQIEETAKLIINSFKLSSKPIFPIFLGGKYIRSGLVRLYDKKIPTFTSLQEAIKSISALYQYHNFNREGFEKIAVSSKIIKNKLNIKVKNEEKVLDEITIDKMFKSVAIPTVKQKLCINSSEAIKFAEDLYPVVLKASTTEIIHKTDKNALYLNITNSQELILAFKKLKKSYSKILVQKQIIEDFKEVFIGAIRDGDKNVYNIQNGAKNKNGFGHMVLFGLGGIYTELFKDTKSVLVPAGKNLIKQEFQKTKIYQILNGFRTNKKYNSDCVIDIVYKLQKLLLLYPEISNIDINPLLVTPKNCITVDVKLFIKN